MSNKKKSSPPPKKTKQPSKSDRVFTIVSVSVCVILLIIAFIAVLPKSSKSEKIDTPNVDALEKGQYYFATIDIYDYGKIKVQLDHTEAPITVENFVKLAKSGFYEGTSFHRIIQDFMMQGGGTMIAAKEPEAIVGEFKANGYDNNIAHKRGVISMARTSEYNSATSQFFIMQTTKTHLDGKYAAFGYVVEGMDVVDTICDTVGTADDSSSIELTERPIINTVTITVETVS